MGKEDRTLTLLQWALQIQGVKHMQYCSLAILLTTSFPMIRVIMICISVKAKEKEMV